MINVFNEDDEWQVWNDDGVGEKQGHCIGAGASKHAALQNASDGLVADINRVRELLECESQSPKKP